MILLGFAIYSEMRFRVCFSMSPGWSPIGTCVLCQQSPNERIFRETNLGQTWQIDQCQAQNMRRVDLEIDRLPIDAFVASSNARSLCLNFSPHVVEVIPFPTRNMIELCPFLLSSNASWSMWNMNFVVSRAVVSVARYVDELENQGASGNNATSSRQKISAYDVLED